MKSGSETAAIKPRHKEVLLVEGGRVVCRAAETTDLALCIAYGVMPFKIQD